MAKSKGGQGGGKKGGGGKTAAKSSSLTVPLAVGGSAMLVVAVAVAALAGSWGRDAGPSGAAAGMGQSAKAAKSKNISWNSHDASDVLSRAPQRNVDQSTLPGVEPQPILVSQSPGIYLFEDILTKEECEYLISLATGRLQPAGVVLQTDDKYAVQAVSRNNEQIWITPQEENELPILRHVIKRLHRAARIPDTDAEALQIGRYVDGQKYESHLDSDPSHDVARPATMLIYLSDVEEGGHTLFPLNERAACSAGWRKDASGEQRYGCAICCEGKGQPGTVRVAPKRGRAVLFFNHLPSGEVDRLSEHAACPIKVGAKWIAQRWFRYKPYQNIRFAPDARFDGVPQLAAAEAAGPWDGRVRELSPKAPRVFLLDGFLSAEEVAHLASLGQPAQQKTRIAAEVEKGDLVVARIAKRLHRAAYMPDSHGEPLELLRFEDGSQEAHSADDGKTYATILVFLSGGEADGGELLLPLRASKCSSLADCCSSSTDKVARIPASRGRAVLFYPREEKRRPPIRGPCPVQAGSLLLARRAFGIQPVGGVEHARDASHDILRPTLGAEL